MQFGSAWWFLDQLDGMDKQINALSNMGLLSRFVGMLTDSRSFLSYSRHDYFRRLLCNLLGNDVEAGRLPDDTALLGRWSRTSASRTRARTSASKRLRRGGAYGASCTANLWLLRAAVTVVELHARPLCGASTRRRPGRRSGWRRSEGMKTPEPAHCLLGR
jgi:hypothetical protein